MLATAGFLTIGAFLALILLARAPVVVALILTPIVAAFLTGSGGELPSMAAEGIRTVAPVCVLLMFAILYFGLMLDTGLFEPLVKWLSGMVHDDPIRLCLISALLTFLVALDGDGTTTILITVHALLPLHRRLGLNPLILPTIIGLSIGVMNVLPWGGPTARTMAALNANVTEVFLPILPASLTGIICIFAIAWIIGYREKQRLAAAGLLIGYEKTGSSGDDKPHVPIDRIFLFNVALTAGLLLMLFASSVPLYLLFMAAFAIALPVNRRTLKSQQDQLASHAPSIVLSTSMIFAAGIFTGILNGTGMIDAMAMVLSGTVPVFLHPYLGEVVALSSVPLNLVFTPDSYYYGIIPVFAETAKTLGQDPISIGRAALLGHTTTGALISPLIPPTFILVSMCEVTLRDHQKYMFKWALLTTVVMTIVASAMGII